MKKIFIVLGLAVGVLTSCTQDISEDAVKTDGKKEFSVVLESTRTHLGDKNDETGKYKVCWSNGDRIVVNGQQSNSLSGIEEGATTATFGVEGIVNAPYDIMYPASAYEDGNAVLPAVQAFAPASFAEGSAVLVGRSATEEISLKNACGFIRLQLTKGNELCGIVKYVKFFGNADEAVCGRFAVDYEGGKLTLPETAADDAKVITLECGNGEAVTADAKSFIVAVPAQTFASGFTFEIVDTEGHLMRVKSNKEQIVEAGSVLAMPSVAFKPTETLLDIEISTAADMVALADAVKGGFYGGSYYLANDIDMSEVTGWEGIGVRDDSDGFAGTFDGRGHSIKNFRSSAPIFKFALRNSVIKDVVIDESCRFELNTTVTDDNVYLAPLVGMGRGVVENCVNNAEVVYTGTANHTVYVGGIIARLYRQGRVSGCVNNAAVSADCVDTGKDVNVGGVAAAFDRSNDGDSAEFYGNTNNGTVTNNADTKTLTVGGVVGRNSHLSCIVTDCINKGEVVSACNAVNNSNINSANYIGGVCGRNTGKMRNCTNFGKVLSSSNYYQTRIGGVCGTGFSNTLIEGCVNEASASVTYSNERKNSADDKVLLNEEHLGGVIGQCEGSIENCTNKGAVNSMSGCVSANVGGVCGYVRNAATVLSGNVNEGAVTVENDVTNNTVGGVYGSFGKAQTVTDAVTGNSGTVTVKKVYGANNSYLRCGGIVGFVYPTTTLANIKNSGAITVDLQAAFNYYAVGGIAGVVESGASNVTNEGKISVNNNVLLTNKNSKIYLGGIAGWNWKATANLVVFDGCDNNAEVEVLTSDKAFSLLPVFNGGILGYTGFPVEIKGCNNTAYLNTTGADAKYNGIFSATGGIVAAVNGASAAITDCNVTSDVRHFIWNNTWDNPAASASSGGVVGCAIGADDANRITVTNCSCTGSVEGRRASAGGIVGYAKFVSVADCRFKGEIIGYGPHFPGGIAGSLVDSSIANSSVESTCIYCHSATDVTADDVTVSYFNVGGIAAYTSGVSSISECSVVATLVQNSASKVTVDNHLGMGMLVGWVAGGTTTISDCGFGGSFYTGDKKPQNQILVLDGQNYESCAVGRGTATLNSNYYWGGQE
ncbi:MAG: hypothetical protein J6K28_00775 [Alistipes sp.]|nr:hypothetical protein [Alistipes sp.]